MSYETLKIILKLVMVGLGSGSEKEALQNEVLHVSTLQVGVVCQPEGHW